jgi:hypothetical protein
MKKFRVPLILLFVVLTVGLVCSAQAKKKSDLWVVSGGFVFGTGNLKLIGAEFPGAITDPAIAESFPGRVADYPEAGINAILVSCQAKGVRFFNPDGNGASAENASRLQRMVGATRYISCNPIITLFDPDPSCRLDSEEAYLNAARWVVDTLREEKGFILCVSDRCDDPRWSEGNLPLEDLQLVDRIAAAIHEASPGRVVLAGGNDPGVIQDLIHSAPSVDAPIGHVDRLGYGEGALPFRHKPAIEVVDAEIATDEELERAIKTVNADTSYAFAVSGLEGSKRQMVLDRFKNVTDRYLIALSSAVPPDPDDGFSLAAGEAEEGFVSLFNGRDLSGWVRMCEPDDFVVRDGCIELIETTGGWLRSYHSYGDFVFRGEYLIGPGENSGIWFRAHLNGRNSRIGFEFQILGTPPNTPPSEGGHGSIYGIRAPDEDCASPAGEWNDLEVTCRGPHVRVVWNGKEVHNVKYEDFEGMRNRKQHGYIGLTDHDGFVKFRNLRIKSLDN